MLPTTDVVGGCQSMDDVGLFHVVLFFHSLHNIMTYTNRITTNADYQKNIFIDRIFKPFCEVVRIRENELTEVLFNKFDVYHQSYSDDSLYWAADGYWEKVVIPHKIEVYKSGMLLLETVLKADKYFVDKEAFKKRLIEHDLSKFSWNETSGYMNHVFGGENSEEQKKDFKRSWHHHKQHNSHHPEYWFDVNKKGETSILPMRRLDILEMVADWIGAGKSYSTPFEEWAQKNLSNFTFHEKTKKELMFIFKAISFNYSFS